MVNAATIFGSWKFVTDDVVLNHRSIQLRVLDFFVTHVMITFTSCVAGSNHVILVNHSVFISLHMLLL